MKFEKRRCIFTNQESDAKLKVSKRDKYNWAKSVPCTKAFLEKKGDKSLTTHEFELVELFFNKELVLAKLSNIELKMKETRSLLDPNALPEFEEYVDLTPEEADKAAHEEGLEEIAVTDFGAAMLEKIKELRGKGFLELIEEAHELTEEDKEWLDAPMGPVDLETETLTHQEAWEEPEEKIVEKKEPDIWD